MRKTDFNFLNPTKRLMYEQLSRSYKMKEPLKTTSWTPFPNKLLESTITLVTVAGAYLNNQEPFTNEGKKSDYKFREIPLNFDPADLRFFAPDWNIDEAKEDYNVVFPLGRLILLQKEGKIGKLTDNSYSFSGICDDEKMFTSSVKSLVNKLQENKSEGALIIPTSYMTGEAACKMAAIIEKNKISTAVLSPFYEQTAFFAPPRSAFINFPFGRLLGKANHITLQTAILRDVLRLFEKSKNPGEILNLNYIWSFEEVPV